MLMRRQFKSAFMLFGFIGLMGWSTAQAQTIGVIRQDEDRSSTVTRSTSRSTQTQVDRSSYRSPDYYLRYDDKHFGFQIGTPPCYYDCDNYGRRPPYYNGYPGNGWQHQQSSPRPYYNTPRQPGTLDPLR